MVPMSANDIVCPDLIITWYGSKRQRRTALVLGIGKQTVLGEVVERLVKHWELPVWKNGPIAYDAVGPDGQPFDLKETLEDITLSGKDITSLVQVEGRLVVSSPQADFSIFDVRHPDGKTSVSVLVLPEAMTVSELQYRLAGIWSLPYWVDEAPVHYVLRAQDGVSLPDKRLSEVDLGDGQQIRLVHKEGIELKPLKTDPDIDQMEPQRRPTRPTKPPRRSKTITWLHLSDLHFRPSQNYDRSIVLRALLRDVKECRHNEGWNLDFVIISGDIAFSGAAQEYALAKAFLDNLLKEASLPKERLFLIPGNHDVDRNAISALAAGAPGILGNRDIVNRVLADDNDRTLLLRRFHNYQGFIASYFDRERTFDSEHYFYVEKLQVANRCVAVSGLNSAWLAASDHDRNRLLLGERQAHAALDDMVDADLRLAILHHPFDWLQDFDRDNVEPILRKECHFVLHGHMHQVGLLQVRSPDSEAIIIAAGACYETREHPNSYNFVRLDYNSGHGTIYLRMYADRQGGFWTKDVINYRDARDGTWEFSLPKSLG